MRTGIPVAVVLLGGISMQALAQAPVPAPACDRACLEGFIDRYLHAMMDNEVRDDLFARDVKFTENGIRLPLGGEGLWHGMSSVEGYRFYVPDIETQQVAFIGTVREHMASAGENDAEANNIAVAIRLKVVDDRITEVEQLAIRPRVQLFGDGGDEGPFGNTGDNVLAMGEPHEIYRTPIPESERHTREELVEAANHYFTALARHDSQGYYPFTEDCVRYENGIVASSDCKTEFESDRLNNIVDRIRDRRFVAVDVEMGIAYSFAFFDHYRINWTWQLAELFRIENGKIRRIEAVFHQAPFGISSGWSPYELSITESIQSIR